MGKGCGDGLMYGWMDGWMEIIISPKVQNKMRKVIKFDEVSSLIALCFEMF